MDEKDILKSKLVTFLKSHNAYELYIRNLKEHSSHGGYDIDSFCSNRTNGFNARKAIVCSFFWDRTPEGFDFWRELHDYFYDNYESLPYEDVVDEEWDNMWDN